jgi:hypothetical protein
MDISADNRQLSVINSDPQPRRMFQASERLGLEFLPQAKQPIEEGGVTNECCRR